MKKLILLVFLFAFGTSFASNTVRKIESKKTKKTFVYTHDKKSKKSKLKKPLCRICCSVTVFNGTGMGSTVTVCAGWLLTSCETAAERACDRAEAAADEILNPG